MCSAVTWTLEIKWLTNHKWSKLDSKSAHITKMTWLQSEIPFLILKIQWLLKIPNNTIKLMQTKVKTVRSTTMSTSWWVSSSKISFILRICLSRPSTISGCRSKMWMQQTRLSEIQLFCSKDVKLYPKILHSCSMMLTLGSSCNSTMWYPIT